MNMPYMPNRNPHPTSVGEKASFSRTLMETDVALFIGVTWDVNPLHTNDHYVSEMPFQRQIVPGLLTASMLTHLGGLWAFLALEMHFKFLAPFYIGETMSAEAVVVEADSERFWVKLNCHCINTEGKEVLLTEIQGDPEDFGIFET
jgi:3-hydroxybutyryl-CoA dehydratase